MDTPLLRLEPDRFPEDRTADDEDEPEERVRLTELDEVEREDRCERTLGLLDACGVVRLEEERVRTFDEEDVEGIARRTLGVLLGAVDEARTLPECRDRAGAASALPAREAFGLEEPVDTFC